MTTALVSPVRSEDAMAPPTFCKGRVKNLPRPKTLKELISGLHKIFEDDNIEVEEVKEYMESYVANKDDWKEMAAFDTHRYTRNLIDEGNGKFNLILLCWGEGHGSSIHDHSESHCFMKIMDGSLCESQYAWPTKKSTHMQHTNTSCYCKDQVAYINDSIGLHRVENKSHAEKAVSLHLYSPPFDMCQSFDERSGHKVKCNVTFHTKFGEKVCYRKTK